MKSKQLYIVLALAAISCLAFTGIRLKTDSNNEGKKYEHLFIIAEHWDLDNVCCSIDGKEFKKFRFAKQVTKQGDLNPLINLIHQFEEEDWELISTGLGTVPGGNHGFWMRRAKK